MAPSLRILFLIDEMKALTDGGTERQVLQMVRLLRRQGSDVQLCLLRGTGWLTPELAGCPVHFANVRSLLHPLGLKSLWRLRSWLRAQQFDVVQSFFVDANIIGPILARLAGVPVILGSRRNLNYWMTARHRVLQRLSNAVVTRLVANCQAVRVVTAKTESISSEKIDVIYNGVDVQHFIPNAELRLQARARLNCADDDVVVGMVAVLRPVKGCEAFVDAALRIVPAIPNARFVLAGDGPLRQALQDRGRPVGERLTFTGSVEDVRSVLAAFDVAVLCSESEGFSNSILEYMAMGLPAVVTDVGGNAEAIADAGVVVPPGDREALAGAISELIRRPADRADLARRARQRALEFSLDALAPRLQGYYLNLMPKRS